MAETSFTPAELNEGFVVAIQIAAKEGEENAVADALPMSGASWVASMCWSTMPAVNSRKWRSNSRPKGGMR
jgi:hypothetical protein